MTSEGSHNSVFSPLYAEMRCCIISDPSGQIAIIHDKDIKSELQWVEYDPKDNKLFLIHSEGQVQDLGIYPEEAMKRNLAHGTEVRLLKFEDKQFRSEQTVVLLIKDY